ncbi:hypothetical protein ACRQ5Q_33100 [Bradyrhizobium sp. PMVTL-01]|uniref:hypothetical protein n=1 Tax=Bradyrhizobium sp. PMVTL-01 TaxID=3434999 RepID=UPI003F700522
MPEPRGNRDGKIFGRGWIAAIAPRQTMAQRILAGSAFSARSFRAGGAARGVATIGFDLSM